MMRVGQGFDVHMFAAGRPLILGGVRIPHDKGLAGHSDADVLIHAVCDALLGAAALGDIGRHFPDTDDRWKGADSAALLATVMERVAETGWRPVNVDATVLAQKPRLAPHVPAMRERLAALLGLDVDAVSVKATTTEHLGFIGRGEGMGAMAVAMLARASE